MKNKRKSVNIKKFTLEQFLEKAKEIHGDRYDYSKVIYKGYQTKICIICLIHGEFWQTPAGHLQGKNCFKCRNENLTIIQTITTEEFIRRARLIHGNKFDYSKVEYKGYNIKVIIICPVHGEFLQAPYKHLEGRGCWQCKSSKGELAIKNILDKYKIKYIKEYKFPNYKLRYDFYLPELNILIEFHGGQHFRPIEYFGGEKRFKNDQKQDIFKKELAKLARIPIIYFTYKHLRMPKEKFEEFVLMVINKF